MRVANFQTIWTVLYDAPSAYNWMLQYYLRAEGLALLIVLLVLAAQWLARADAATVGVFGAVVEVVADKPIDFTFEPIREVAFLFVGIAYFITAVLAPLLMLVARDASWSFPAKGLWWSLIAGIAGAIGATVAMFYITKRTGKPDPATAREVAGAIDHAATVARRGGKY